MQALILFTDGQQSSAVLGNELFDAARRLRDRGIRLYVVGIGTELDRFQLSRIADSEDRLLIARTYDELLQKVEDEVNQLADAGCQGMTFLFVFCMSAISVEVF